MDFFGIGIPEIIFIVLIALIILGPRDMIKAGRSIGRFLNKLVRSPTWSAIQQTSREIRTLPNRLMREAGLEDIEKELPNPRTITNLPELEQIKKDAQSLQSDISPWTTPTKSNPDKAEPPGEPVENHEEKIEKES
jgi:sec-independent protein translocase protein TatB